MVWSKWPMAELMPNCALTVHVLQTEACLQVHRPYPSSLPCARKIHLKWPWETKATTWSCLHWCICSISSRAFITISTFRTITTSFPNSHSSDLIVNIFSPVCRQRKGRQGLNAVCSLQRYGGEAWWVATPFCIFKEHVVFVKSHKKAVIIKMSDCFQVSPLLTTSQSSPLGLY